MQSQIYDKFVDALKAKAEQCKIGQVGGPREYADVPALRRGDIVRTLGQLILVCRSDCLDFRSPARQSVGIHREWSRRRGSCPDRRAQMGSVERRLLGRTDRPGRRRAIYEGGSGRGESPCSPLVNLVRSSDPSSSLQRLKPKPKRSTSPTTPLMDSPRLFSPTTRVRRRG